MNNFIKVDDEFLNLKYIKNARFEKDGTCSFLIANTQMVAVNADIRYYKMEDNRISSTDVATCNTMKLLFNYYARGTR